MISKFKKNDLIQILQILKNKKGGSSNVKRIPIEVNLTTKYIRNLKTSNVMQNNKIYNNKNNKNNNNN